MDKEFLIYIAGFFDGEGSVGIYRQNSKESQRSFFLSVSIAQKKSKVSTKIEKKLVKTFRGNSYLWKTKSNSTMWKWQCVGEDARLFLLKIYKYLIIKKRQARIALVWQKNRIKLKSGPIKKDLAIEKWIKNTQLVANTLKQIKRGDL